VKTAVIVSFFRRVGLPTEQSEQEQRPKRNNPRHDQESKAESGSSGCLVNPTESADSHEQRHAETERNIDRRSG
jgi:hypothetical protein